MNISDNDHQGVTISSLSETYLSETVLRPPSIRQYRLVVRLFVAVEGDLPISKVDRAAVIRFRNEVLSRASAVTFNNYRRHLRTLWNFAIRHQLLTTNPFADVRPAPEPRKRKKTITADGLSCALDYLRQEASKPLSDQKRLKPAWFWLIVVQLLYATGIRRRQLVELRWGHLDLVQGVLLLVAEGSKNYREWSVPIPQHLIESLTILRRCTIDRIGTSNIGAHQIFNVTLFNPKYQGDRLTVNHVHAFFRHLSKATGVRITPHRLRHTIATNLANHPCVNMKSVQELLGHTDLRTTLEYYVETDVEHLRKMIEEVTKEKENVSQKTVTQEKLAI